MLAGHGSLEGPVTVTVVARPGVTGGAVARAGLVSAGERARRPVSGRPGTGPRLPAGTAPRTHTRHRPHQKEPP